MSAATDVIREVDGLGIQLWVDGDNLRIRAPKGVVTPELLEDIKRHKKELLHLEMWNFRHLEIPSQEQRGKVDVWLVGEQEGSDKLMICYVGPKAAG